MANNNINSLTFEHHDTYIDYVDNIVKSKDQVVLTPINLEDTDTDIVIYSSNQAHWH